MSYSDVSNVEEYFKPMSNEQLFQALGKYQDNWRLLFANPLSYKWHSDALRNTGICINVIRQELANRNVQIIEWEAQ